MPRPHCGHSTEPAGSQTGSTGTSLTGRIVVARLIFSLVVLVSLTGCDGATAPVEGPELGLLDPAIDWIGEYTGSGQGTVDGSAAVILDAVITVALDPDDVKLADCTNCVTVTLDDVFLLSNVRIDNLTAVDLTYLDGKVRYTLELRRFTLGNDHPNLLRARATFGNEGATAPIFDVEYVLER